MRGRFFNVRHAGLGASRTDLCEKPGANFSVDEIRSGVGENSSCRAAAAQASPPGTNRTRPVRAAARQVWIRAMRGNLS